MEKWTADQRTTARSLGFILFCLLLAELVKLGQPSSVPQEFSGSYNERAFRLIRQYHGHIQTAIRRYCRYRPPRFLVHGLIRQESGGEFYKINYSSAASGLGQFIPGSAHRFGLTPTLGNIRSNHHVSGLARRMRNARTQCRRTTKTWKGFYECLIKKDARFNPYRSVVATVRHLCEDYNRLRGWGSDPDGRIWRLALQSYYQGMHTVRRSGLIRQLERKLILRFPISKTGRVSWGATEILSLKRLDYFVKIYRWRYLYERWVKRNGHKIFKPLSDHQAFLAYDHRIKRKDRNHDD